MDPESLSHGVEVIIPSDDRSRGDRDSARGINSNMDTGGIKQKN